MTGQLYFLQLFHMGRADFFATIFLLHRPCNIINFALSFTLGTRASKFTFFYLSFLALVPRVVKSLLICICFLLTMLSFWRKAKNCAKKALTGGDKLTI